MVVTGEVGEGELRQLVAADSTCPVVWSAVRPSQAALALGDGAARPAYAAVVSEEHGDLVRAAPHHGLAVVPDPAVLVPGSCAPSRWPAGPASFA